MDAEERARRIMIEAEKLVSAHPDLIRSGNTYHCFIRPSKGPQRRIEFEVPVDYPFVAPRVRVRPYSDLSGVPHILAEGEVCYMHIFGPVGSSNGWNPALHTLTYVITQAKRIVYEAVNERYGA